MKNILCFGDSNTWGYIPGGKGRFEFSERWPGILQSILGEEYHVYENGLNGRTTVFDDPVSPYRNGVKGIIPAIMISYPLDILFIMLGTNDTKPYFGASGAVIAMGMKRIVETAKGWFMGSGMEVPRIIIAAPIDILPLREIRTPFPDFNDGSTLKLQEMREWYQAYAELEGCEYFNAGSFASPSRIDGIHMESEEHRKLAAAAADLIRSI